MVHVFLEIGAEKRAGIREKATALFGRIMSADKRKQMKLLENKRDNDAVRRSLEEYDKVFLAH